MTTEQTTTQDFPIETALTRDAVTDLLDSLATDARYGDSEPVDIGNGWAVRVRTEPDETASLDDYECYGRVESARPNRYDAGYHRPEWADGSARLIHVGRGSDAYWWLPYRDSRKVYNSDTDYRTVRDLLEYGFTVLILELCHGEDYYGYPIVVEVESVGSVDPSVMEDHRALVEWLYDLWIPLVETVVRRPYGEVGAAPRGWAGDWQ